MRFLQFGQCSNLIWPTHPPMCTLWVIGLNGFLAPSKRSLSFHSVGQRLWVIFPQYVDGTLWSLHRSYSDISISVFLQKNSTPHYKIPIPKKVPMVQFWLIGFILYQVKSQLLGHANPCISPIYSILIPKIDSSQGLLKGACFSDIIELHRSDL